MESSPPVSPQLPLFGVANYLSFDEAGFFLDRISKLNVLIGKNNSGKSNVLRAIQLLGGVRPNEKPKLDALIHGHRRNGKDPSVTVDVPLDSFIKDDNDASLRTRLETIGKSSFRARWRIGTNQLEGDHPLAGLDWQVLDRFMLILTGSQYGHEVNETEYLDDTRGSLAHHGAKALESFQKLIYIPNFREIRTAGEENIASGQSVIPRLHRMQVPEPGKEAERDVFARIQGFVQNLLGEPDLKIEIPEAKDKIIVAMHGNRLPLQSFGTGVHQLVILCSALAMHDGYVVCIEEPEIHMHPELQRKFIRFLKTTNNTYFIATHSAVYLDFIEDATIYHVTYDGEKSTVKRVEANPNAREVLTDMGYKASDLLQANGVIWVEGPSDRVYLNKWLSLIDPNLVEGVHYAVAFYGGRLLTHISAADDPDEDVIQVLKINRNAVCIIDRDGSTDATKLNATKERVLKELGEDACWITKGREIENYLRRELIEDYLSKKCERSIKLRFRKNDKLEKAIVKAQGDVGPRVNYHHSKVAYAHQFAELMTPVDLNVLDLSERLVQLVERIRGWNP